MIKKIKLKQATILFNIIAIVVLLGSFAIYDLYKKTKKDIENIAINSQIEYIDDITDNISKSILLRTGNTIYNTLKSNEELRGHLDEDLEPFVTNRYKYVYIVDKESVNSDEFRFLLDGSEEKSEFEEPYTPLDMDVWNSVYKTKQAKYFKHQGDNENIWITYLKPIVVEGKVSAIIVIDFSLKASEDIVSALDELTYAFNIAIIFAIIIFLVIIGFSYIDTKREKVKALLYNQLKDKTQKISEFNKTLKQKVEDEVAKNREKDKQILQQSRLAQMGEMIGMIAHQWRQPLAAISSTSSAIKLKATLGKLEHSTAVELATKISEYSQHLSVTIDDFREFFKPNKEKKESSFDELAQSVLSIVGETVSNKGIEITQELECHDRFYSYPNELKQVILNLIKNAEDILLEKEIENPYIKIKSYKEDDNLVLEVSDNGGGVPETILDKVFDPYFSTKKEKDGTGLGLYMSKTIVETHCDGKLSVRNDENGAVFKINLLETRD